MPARSSSTARPREIFAAPKHPYTQALVDSILDPWEPEARASRRSTARRPTWPRRRPAAASIRAAALAMDVCRASEPATSHLGAGPQRRSCWLHAAARGRAHERRETHRGRAARRCTFPVRRGLFGRAAQRVHAVDGVDLALHENETVALVGESGSGKTTLGLAILGLRALVGGRDPLARPAAVRRSRGAALQGLPPRRAGRVPGPLRLAQSAPADRGGAAPSAARCTAIVPPAEMRGRGGAAARARRPARRPRSTPTAIRTNSAAASASASPSRARSRCSPSILVADEPVSALDVSIRAQILKLLRDAQARTQARRCCSSATTSASCAIIADRVAVMYLGKIVEIAPVDALFRPAASSLYAHAAQRGAVGAPGARRRRRRASRSIGDPPSPTDPPSGCRFRTRCPFAFDRCATEEPRLRRDRRRTIVPPAILVADAAATSR